MEKGTQKDWVVNRLIMKGKISRNECLRNYITRLGAIILRLKNEGWEIEAEFVPFQSVLAWRKKDYVYTVKKYPPMGLKGV